MASESQSSCDTLRESYEKRRSQLGTQAKRSSMIVASKDDVETVIQATAVALRRQNADSTVCHNCRHDDLETCKVEKVDKRGLIRTVSCKDCPEVLEVRCHHSKRYWERVDDAADLIPGDHIFWHRVTGYSHHAIVTEVSGSPRKAAVRQPDSNRGANNEKFSLTVVEYDLSEEKPWVEVQQSELERECSCAAFCGGSLYRLQYDDCYINDYVRLRAVKGIGKLKYNLTTRNCEHDSHWCKTGRRESRQVKTLFISMGKVALSIFLRFLGLIALWVVQIVHERHEGVVLEEERRRLRSFERILNLLYIVAMALLFTGYFIHKGSQRLKPKPREIGDAEAANNRQSRQRESTATEKARDSSNVCSPDGCANCAYKNCTSDCCGAKCKACCRGLCCFACCTPFCCSSFAKSLCLLCFGAIANDCRGNSRGHYCCRRATPAVIRLCIRISIREFVAASGPFLVTWFEDELESSVGWYFWPTLIFKLFLLILSSAVFYVLGTIVGSFFEELFELFRKLCCFERGQKWKDKLVKTKRKATRSDSTNESNQYELYYSSMNVSNDQPIAARGADEKVDPDDVYTSLEEDIISPQHYNMTSAAGC